jgi:hypothetical protein
LHHLRALTFTGSSVAVGVGLQPLLGSKLRGALLLRNKTRGVTYG